MTDPRPELRLALARWLRLRAKVRALAHALAAGEHRVRRALRASADESDVALLTAQLADERAAVDALGRELDARIADVNRECAAVEASFVAELIARARGRRGRSGNPACAREGSAGDRNAYPPGRFD